MAGKKAISIQRSFTKPKHYFVAITSDKCLDRNMFTHVYDVTQKRLGKILAIVGHQNFYFDCDNGEITLFGEYDGRKP